MIKILKPAIQKIERSNQSDLDDTLLNQSESVHSLADSLTALQEAQQKLKSFSAKDLCDFFDLVAGAWMKNENGFFTKYSSVGISFLLNFMRGENLKALLSSSLLGNIKYSDQFILHPPLKKFLKVVPKGVLVHWLAGNVPVLGMISLIQGIITKNINIAKLPKSNGLLLPSILAEIGPFSLKTTNGMLTGNDILNTILFVYCDRNDKTSQQQLSDLADVRIAWGGKEAVESVCTLTKRYFTDDVIFGPKYSFAILGKDALSESQLIDFGYKMALDASVFEQQGCNSPHTLFVEKSNDYTLEMVAKSVASGMQQVLKRIPKPPISGKQAINITNLRAEAIFDGKLVIQSPGTEWTIVYSESKPFFADACYSRVLFIQEVKDALDVLPLIKHHHQTMGLCMKESRRSDFSEQAANSGIERITAIGKMTIYDHPWDGMFPMSKFVKWVSRGD